MNLSIFADANQKTSNRMKEKIISTTYAPLEAPYQMISYSNTLGMQIGTLIVTTADEDSTTYAIRTHSHPVVAYANKKDEGYRKKRFTLPTMEGVVWDQVELRDVTTICLADEPRMSWQKYHDYLFNDLRMHYYSFPLSLTSIILLKDFGIQVEWPEAGDYTIQLEKYTNTDDDPIVRSTQKSVFVMAVHHSDLESMENGLLLQLKGYYTYMRFGRKPSGKKIRLSFTTFDPELTPIVAKLNAQHEMTEYEIYADEKF